MNDFDLTAEELKLFLEEAYEQLEIMEDVLIELEQYPEESGLIQEIFRAAHTLKGGAATIGFEAMATLAHEVESLLDQIREGTRRMSADLGDLFLASIDMFRRCLNVIDLDDGDGDLPFDQVDVTPLLERIEALKQSEGSEADDATAQTPEGEVPSQSVADHTAEQGPTTAEAEPMGVSDASGASEDAAGTTTSAADGTPRVALADLATEHRQEIEQWLQAGESVYHLEFHISPGTAMPSVRAYQIILTLEDYGTIIACEPSRESIEQEAIALDRLEVTFRPNLAISATLEELDGMSFLTHIGCREVVLEIAEAKDVASETAADSGELVESSVETPAEGEPSGEAKAEDDKTAPPAEERAARSVDERPAPPARPARAAEGVARRNQTDHGLGQTIRINVSLLDTLMNLVGELVIDRTRLEDIGTAQLDIETLREQLVEVSGRLSRITTDLQETIMQVRMMPVDILFKKFPRMVRDLSRQLDKEITLELYGGETELDRSVIEQIGDPLMHLLRNAVDHGIESPEERRRLGKPLPGRLTLSASHKESQIYITVEDDGRGLNAQVLRQKLLDRGLVSAERLSGMSDEEVFEMIFIPGFSTAEEVSSVSGRGVGMDVVKQNIEKVKGTIEVSSEPGRGTKITIKLPLTLAIIQGLLVEVGNEVFAIPLSSVDEVVHLDPSTIRFARGQEMFPVREEMIPLIDPGQVWGPEWSVHWHDDVARPVVIIRSGSSPIGLKVDKLRGEQEVVIKNISQMIGQVPGISGASILGDGHVALIVDPASLTGAIRHIERSFSA